MHRKLVVVNAEVAFSGGINYSIDHLAEYGPEGKQDYAVEIDLPDPTLRAMGVAMLAVAS